MFEGFPYNLSQKLEQMKFTTVLASVQKIRREGLYDVISPKIPMSMEYRCLHYDHLVFGDPALVIAYITDFYEPYDLSNYLDAHGNSSFVKFSKSSVNLPIGFEFKVSQTLIFLFIQYQNSFLYHYNSLFSSPGNPLKWYFLITCCPPVRLAFYL